MSFVPVKSKVGQSEVYIANLKGSLERSYIIRRPTPDTYSLVHAHCRVLLIAYAPCKLIMQSACNSH
uniref:Uncharacterized protein n=1 Tax=Elaeophora elaphi TaxID=1147741 RepID=A0A0R3RP91_9BILA